MVNKSDILEIDYKINSLHINTSKVLGVYGLLGILQDVAGEHAEKLGFGFEDSLDKGFFWVLVRQKLRMDSWPTWHDIVTVKTWTKPVMGTTAFREFEIFIGDKKIGDCSTTWMILDIQTRAPKIIDDSANLFHSRMDYSLDYTAEKVLLPETLEPITTFDVRISDLDMNNHVNNVKFTQWILDSIPFEYHNSHVIQEYEINFLREVFLADKIEVSSNIHHFHQISNEELFFKGSRENESKPAFIARLLSKDTK